MKWYIRLYRQLKYIFSKKKVDFDGPNLPGHINNELIPEVVFERNVIIHNIRYDKDKKVHIVMIDYLDKEIEV